MILLIIMMIRKKESSHINDRKRMLDQQPREENGGWRGPFSPETSCSRCRNRTHATIPNAKLLHDVDALALDRGRFRKSSPAPDPVPVSEGVEMPRRSLTRSLVSSADARERRDKKERRRRDLGPFG